ncbi:MAG: DUF3179 domain-containing (seleno)protein [Chthoniobacterales bacterium]
MNTLDLAKLLFNTIALAVLWLNCVAAEPSPATPDIRERSRTRFGPPPQAVTDPNSGIAGAVLHEAGTGGQDWHPALNDPEWRRAAEADHIRAEDPIAGLSLHGKSWAIPLSVLMMPHMANLTLDGEPVLVTYCFKCRSAIARTPVVDGRRLTFHLAGIFNGSILITDEQTKSYWTPFTGEALEGALKGATLKQVPLTPCRWSQWVQMHPDTLVADPTENLRARYAKAQSPGSRRSARSFLQFLVQPLDDRLRFDDMVLGVTVGDTTRAYPLAAMDERATEGQQSIALEETLGNEPIVILHQRDSLLTTAFSRRFRGKTLQFITDRDGRFVDSAYRSRWNFDGEALDGAVAGQKLTDIPSQLEEWYIWAAFYPTTSVYENPSSAHSGAP